MPIPTKKINSSQNIEKALNVKSLSKENAVPEAITEADDLVDDSQIDLDANHDQWSFENSIQL